MEIDVRKGFIIYRNGPGPAFVVPHSGPALEIPTGRDDNADTVASLCWLGMGGIMVVSTMPRKMILGIDFNREAPPRSKALGFWDKFQKEEEVEALEEYRHTYAWVARDRKDHQMRLRIYRDFWKSIRGLGDAMVFVHRKFTRMMNFPSIMDVVIYKGYGVNRDIMNSLVSGINERHQGFFKSISGHYKSAILLEEKRALERITKIFGKFSLSDMKIEYREHIKEDMEVIRKFAEARAIKRLDKSFNARNFLSAVRSALKSGGDPRITVEGRFRGEPAWSRKSAMFRRKNMIEVESNAFLNYWYPDEAAEMIMKIIDRVKSIRKLSSYMEREW